MTSVAHAVREVLGDGALERDSGGLPRAVPDSTEAMARLLALADLRDWTLRIEGAGGWQPADAPADLAVSTRGLGRVLQVSPADLVATVQGGVPLDMLHRELATHHMWLAIDPPGRPGRSLGSTLATATSGPLRQGFGPVRDHVLGMAVVTGSGRVVRSGGKVVKNVAGFDLGKLHVGGFGAFGVMTEFHLRLRALPQQDTTLLARGSRDACTAAGRAITEAGILVHALELLSPAVAAESGWVLAARLTGTPGGVAADATALRNLASELDWSELRPDRAPAFWHLASRAMLGGATSFRLGALQPGLDELLDLLEATVGLGLVSAGAGSAGGARWSGDTDAATLRTLRRSMSAMEVPLTLERAPWALRHAVGHFGAWRAGVAPLVGRLREAFDPGTRFAVPLDGEGDPTS